MRPPTRLSWKDEIGVPCSDRQSDRGAGRNSFMSTYSLFHAFTTVLMESVGRPLATKYCDGLVVDLCRGSASIDNVISSGSIDANGLVTRSTPGCSADSEIVGSPIFPSPLLVGTIPTLVVYLGRLKQNSVPLI